MNDRDSQHLKTKKIAGKDEVLKENGDVAKLSKSAQVVAKLCESLPTNAGHKLFRSALLT